MKKYNVNVQMSWLDIITIVIGKIILGILFTLGIVIIFSGIQWFVEIFLMQHLIARIIFYIVGVSLIVKMLYKELA